MQVDTATLNFRCIHTCMKVAKRLHAQPKGLLLELTAAAYGDRSSQWQGSCVQTWSSSCRTLAARRMSRCRCACCATRSASSTLPGTRKLLLPHMAVWKIGPNQFRIVLRDQIGKLYFARYSPQAVAALHGCMGTGQDMSSTASCNVSPAYAPHAVVWRMASAATRQLVTLGSICIPSAYLW